MNLIKNINSKISKPLIMAFFILLLGGVITYYQNQLSKIEIPETTTIIVANQTIRKGEEITGSHLKEKVIHVSGKHEKGISNVSELVGKLALIEIIEGKEITPLEITTREAWLQEEKREVGITFRNFTDIVGGNAKPGDIVDIMLSYPYEERMGEIAIKPIEKVVAAVELVELYNDNNISYQETRDRLGFRPITALVQLTEEEEKAIDEAFKKGRVYARRYGNYLRLDDLKIETSQSERDSVVISGD